MRKRYLLSALILFILSLAYSGGGTCQEEPALQKSRVVGQMFDVLVPVENYNFVRSVLVVFGNKFGPQPGMPEEFDSCAWDHLLYSYEAFRRGIMIQRDDIEKEIGDILKSGGADFAWKEDKDAYTKWVKTKTNEPVELFENQLKHLLEVQKLREQVMEGMKPQVTNKEAYQAFLDEHNSLGVELVEFEKKETAAEFYRKAKADPGFWDAEKKLRPKEFKGLGTVTLIFLMDLWGFQRSAVYRMMRMKDGEIYGPSPIYKGYGVFKVLAKKPADSKKYKDAKDSYFEKVRGRKRYEALGKWFEDLKKKACVIKYYNKGGEE